MSSSTPPAMTCRHPYPFNRRFDALFGLDCRDQGGRMKYIHRGKFGMDIVCDFLESMDLGDKSMQLTLLSLRLNTLAHPRSRGVSDPLPPRAPTAPRLAASAANLESEAADLSNLVQSGPQATQTSSLGTAPATDAATTTLRTKSVDDYMKVAASSSAPAQDRAVRSSKSITRSKDQIPPALLTPAETSDGTSTFQPSDEQKSSSDDQAEDEISEGEVLEQVDRRRKNASSTKAAKSVNARRAAKTQPPATSKRRRRSSASKYQRPPRPTKKKKSERGTISHPLEVSSGEESDGQGALRVVETQEASHGQKRGPENQSLQHWREPVPVNDRKFGARWEFKCRYCTAVRRVKRTVISNNPSYDDEPKQPFLGNLATHIKDKHSDAREGNTVADDGVERVDHGYTLKSAQIMAAFLKEGELNPQVVPTYKGFLRLFAAWILDEDLPFTTGEAPSLRNLFKYLRVNFVLPSDTTVRNTLAHIFTELHGKVVHELTNVKSKLAYSTDTWSTRQMVFTFAGTIATFINDDWELVERLVSFQHLDDNDHKGEYAAKAFVNGAAKRGGLDKFLSITMDNASTNNVLARTLGLLLLKRYGISFDPQNGQIHCIAHAVNLVVQKILNELDEAADPSVDDYYERNKHVPFHYDPEADEDQKALDEEEDDDEFDGDEEPAQHEASNADADDYADDTWEWSGHSVVKKLRLICTKIASSPQRRSSFRKAACSIYKSSHPDDIRRRHLMVIRDVVTRWNYTHAMIERALFMRQAIDTWVFNKPKLRELLLSQQEWSYLKSIAGLLEIFTKVTKAMSQSRVPTLPYVLPMYEHMRKSLLQSTEDPLLPKALQNAAAAGLDKLLQYYEYAKASEHTVLATILHPSLRLRWFDQLAASNISPRKVFEKVYREYQQCMPESETLPAADVHITAGSTDFMDEICRLRESTPDATSQPQGLDDELTRYFNMTGGKISKDDSILMWWKSHTTEFPVISCMARDFLAVPATSVSVERLFSKSRHLCGDLRSSFKAATITEAMCVKMWIRAGLLSTEPPVASKTKK